MRKAQIKVISFIAFILLIAFIGTVYADTGVPAVPEIQGLSTGTSSSVVGTVTETDSGAWITTNDPFVLDTYVATTHTSNQDLSDYSVVTINWPLLIAQLQAAGGSAVYTTVGPIYTVSQLNVPESLLNTPAPGAFSVGQPLSGNPPAETWQQFLALNGFKLSSSSDGGIHSGVLDPGQVQYTTGYNHQYSGISGQQTFTKTMAISTGNTIADQSNIKANTNVQFIAVDTGRATNSEDLLLDGASQAQNSSSLILCPFANANPGIIPAFCNIEQAGSAFDTTLTSTVTSADARFVGTDATIPTVLNYNINSEGITSGNQSSPMIGSVSAYLKVHVQESRNESVISGTSGPTTYSFPDQMNPVKSEDLVYSETSTASGLIGKFSKSMSYSSQASAVPAPVQIIQTFG